MKRLLVLCTWICLCCCPSQFVKASDKDRALGGDDPTGGGGDVLGRCCFLGIVPEPILCEVSTEEECYFNTAPVSWTPGLDCNTPCESQTEFFRGCGTLGVGPQGCPLFNTDDGQSFILQNVGNVIAPRIWVSGVINPQSNLCSPLVLPGLMNNTFGRCFEGCGVLIQGVECILFQADSGGLYILTNLGGFSVGDRVKVRGCLNPVCVSFCQQGNGCIEDNLIEACDPAPTGACCSPLLLNPLSCIVTTPDHCAEIQGSYIGDNTVCTTNPCSTVLGRCCFLGIVPEPVLCEVTTWSNCISHPAFVSWTAGADCVNGCDNIPRGACCVPMNVPGSAYCEVLTAQECAERGGDYKGDGTTCDPAVPCPRLGRCCFVGIVFPPFLCDVTTEEECSFYIGSFWTDGLTCDWPCSDALGSCCFDIDDGPLAYDTCVTNMTQTDCEANGGVFDQGGTCTLVGCCLPTGGCQDADPQCCLASGGQPNPNGAPCSSVGCNADPTGACCIPVATPEDRCLVLTPLQCLQQGGTYQGNGSVCPPSGFCDPTATGACCVPTPIPEGRCLELTALQCAAALGVYHGNGTVCPPNSTLCFPGQRGACCVDVDDGPAQFDTCVRVTPQQCLELGGFFQGVNTFCQVRACCFDNGFCQDMDPRCCMASGGTPAPAGALCSNTTCPVPVRGACCFDAPNGLCTVMTHQECIEAGGTYLGDGTTCGPINVCVPRGACCLTPNVPGTTNCIVTTALHCNEVGGVYRGDGTTCTNTSCPILGRCCFLGIVADPILCEVTTQSSCMNRPGFVSWTAHQTCDTPCRRPDIFRGCGVLGPGPQGCINFLADTGEVFALENGGPIFNSGHVWVRGEIVNPSNLCFPVPGVGLHNNTIGPCFEGCGRLVQGVECVLFHADTGALYLLDNLGGFSVGDRVKVRGCLNPACVSFCQQGNGCIEDNDIEACGDIPRGACCSGVLANPLGCIVTTPANCEMIEGEYQGDGTTCLPNNPCAPRLGRCCFLGFNPAIPLCEVLTRQECMNLPAPISWTPGATCETPCDNIPRGACCVSLGTNAAHCVVVTQQRCQMIGGNYQGDGTTCTANTCPILGRCCFQGIVPFPLLCEVTTRQQCFQFAAPVSWTAGATCAIPCHPQCDPQGDCNGDGVIDGGDVPCFVRAMLGGPASGDHPHCAGMNAASETGQIAAFVELLTNP